MIILDTDIASGLMRSERDPRLVEWINTCPADLLWLTSVSVYEIRLGIESLLIGRRRDQLNHAFDRTLAEDFQGRVLPFDEMAAQIAAALAASRKGHGLNIGIRDTWIAGIAISRRAELATHNVRDFQDIDISVIDPFTYRL